MGIQPSFQIGPNAEAKGRGRNEVPCDGEWIDVLNLAKDYVRWLLPCQFAMSVDRADALMNKVGTRILLLNTLVCDQNFQLAGFSSDMPFFLKMA